MFSNPSLPEPVAVVKSNRKIIHVYAMGDWVNSVYAVVRLIAFVFRYEEVACSPGEKRKV